MGQLLDQLLVRLVFVLDLHHVLERFLEKLNSVDKNGLLRLLLDDKVEDFQAEIGSRSRGQMQVINQLLVFLLDILLVYVDDCGEEGVKTLGGI